MKILLLSTKFPPSIGGIETVTRILADEFSSLGHSVCVVTDTVSSDEKDNVPYRIIRRPSMLELINEIKECNVSLHSCISLKRIWPFLFFRKPIFVTHHTWYHRLNGHKGVFDRLKLFISRFTKNVAVSKAIAQHLPAESTVIGNPYQDDLFKDRHIKSDKSDLVFVGRLVSDKGADILLQALAILREINITPTLSIVGHGPELCHLQATSKLLNLESQVVFSGELSGEALVEHLSKHRIMVIPSVWSEPFGLVALEGLACGLEIISSDAGGLPEALGENGILFSRGDAHDLAEKIRRCLERNAKQVPNQQQRVKLHLEQHKSRNVALRYLEMMERSI